MDKQGQCQVLEVSPKQAWEGLSAENSAALIDVRTRPEWSFVGTPDLSGCSREVILSEWRSFPQLALNADFVSEVLEALDGNVPENIYFLCRSGVRSLEAAKAMAVELDGIGKVANCINVLEGFEGDLDQNRRRGLTNGWKYRGLAWRQS